MTRSPVPNPVARTSRVWDAKRKLWICCVMLTFRGTYEFDPDAEADPRQTRAREAYAEAVSLARFGWWVGKTKRQALESAATIERHAQSVPPERRTDGEA